jgi:Rieske Fe-S protein
MTDESKHTHCATRRCVLLGAGVVGAAGLLTACSTAAVPYDQDPEGGPYQGAPATVPAGASTPSPSGAPVLLGETSSIPVGGGTYFASAQVVITQPTEGKFMGFTAICTHVGCPCTTVTPTTGASVGTINCPCHGSKFKITDGSVVPGSGPAQEPLGAIPFMVSQGNVYFTGVSQA